MSSEPVENGTVLRSPTAHAGSKLTLAALGILLVAVTATLLPGVTRLLPLPGGVTAALGMALLSVAIAVVLATLAPRLARSATIAAGRPEAFARDVGSLVHWATILAAVLALHRGFTPLAAALLDGYVVVFDLAFLVLALPPFLIVVLRLYFCLDPLADRLATRMDASD